MKRIIKLAVWACLGISTIISCNSTGNETAPATDTVFISQMKFQPEELYINKWDTIVWINNDIVSHDVTEFPEKAWTSDTIAPGESWKTVLGKNTDYFCSIHPTMKAKIIIRE